MSDGDKTSFDTEKPGEQGECGRSVCATESADPAGCAAGGVEEQATPASAVPDLSPERAVKKPTVRRVVVALIFLVVGIGIVAGVGGGTISSFGWGWIASVCPLGALESMVASRLFIPQAVVALVVAALVFGLLGKVFCAWVCPIPSMRSILDAVRRRTAHIQSTTTVEDGSASAVSLRVVRPCAQCKKEVAENSPVNGLDRRAPSLPEGAPENKKGHRASCGACAPHELRKGIDSRHLILGGSLLGAAIFGFPVFCLICPIGLTFGCIVLVAQLFGIQTLSWGLLLFPLVLILELTVLRRWCSKICPLGALISLFSLPNRFFRPRVDEEKCLRSKGVDCRICTDICPESLDPHHTSGMHECSKCRDCSENCPAGAISFPRRRS